MCGFCVLSSAYTRKNCQIYLKVETLIKIKPHWHKYCNVYLGLLLFGVMFCNYTFLHRYTPCKQNFIGITLSVCPFMHLSIYPSVHLSICPFIRLSIYPFVHSSVCPFIRLSIHPFVHSSVCPFICLSIHPSVHSAICPFIHLSIFLLSATDEPILLTQLQYTNSSADRGYPFVI